MWGWIAKLRQYVNRLSNFVLRRSTLRSIVDANISSHQQDILALNQQLLSDAITVGEWQTSFQQHIKDSILQQYLLGRGGQTQMTQTDFGSVGGVYAEQLRWAKSFAQEIADGNLSPGAINRRSVMYINSSREAYNRALARSYGVPLEKLDVFPGDDKSCLGLTNCGCFLEFEEKKTLWKVYWRLGVTEHCVLCIQRSRDWNPFIVYKEESIG